MTGGQRRGSRRDATRVVRAGLPEPVPGDPFLPGPVFAAPYHVLGQTLEQEGRLPEALSQYKAFLALSSKTDLRRAEAENRVRSLTASGGQ